MKTIASKWLISFLIALFAAPWAMAADEAYPARPIRLIVPAPAGGSSDVLARKWAEAVGRALHSSIVVENKPGANGILASSYVAKQPADGYTLLLTGISYLVFNPLTYKSLPYNPEKDFDGVALLASTPFLLVANPKTQFQTLADLTLAARTKPGEITYASAGHGNSTQLVTEMLAERLDIKLMHVPYNGGAAAMQGVAGGQVMLMSDTLNTGSAQAAGGRVTPLLVLGPRRSHRLPNVPTLADLGINNFPLPSWFALAAPAGTPASILQRLNAETQAFFKAPETKAWLESQQLEPIPSQPQDVKVWMKREAATWSGIIHRLGIKND